ncbi:MAG: SUMF1/EgtB/PvdO family nonheme iron enzyme [Amphritea sp.]
MARPLKISGYTIEKEIGKGAMATVYLAIQDSLSRHVALKVMSPLLAAEETFAKRFIHEGKTVAKLEQNNIVNIFDIGTSEICCYIAMEYLSGGTLKDRMSREMNLDEALHITRQIAQALGYAHQHNFIHRDIKPLNIMFRADKTAVLTDFGIAKDIEEAATALTATGASIGTPSYMSPEQAKGEELDGRSDIYCLGTVFYELLTGSRPYVASDPFALALKHISAPIPKLPERLGFLQGTLNKLMAKHPNKRFQTAEEFIAEIDRILDKYDTHKIRVLLQDEQGSDKTELWHQTVLRHLPSGSLPSRLKQISKWGGGVLMLGVVVWAATEQYLNYRDTVKQQQILEHNQRIELLLAKGERQIALSQLFLPPEDNAFDTYLEVIELEPENERAKASITALLEQIHIRAQQAVENTEWNEALSLIDNGLRLNAQHEPLLSLQLLVNQAQEHEQQEKLAREREARVAELLAQAEQQIKNHQLSQPAGNNAFETLKEVLKLAPEDSRAMQSLQQIADSYAQLAREQLDQGRYAQSEVLIGRGLAVIPGDAALVALLLDLEQRKTQSQLEALLAEAEALAAQEQFSQPTENNAADRFKAVLGIDPDNEIAQRRMQALPKQILALAESARVMGNLARSLALTEQGLLLNPDGEELLAQKKHVLLDQQVDRLLEKALDQLGQQRITSPQNDNALDTLSEILEHPPDHTGAQEELQQIADAFAERTSALLAQGKESESQAILEQVLAFFPGNKPLLAVRNALERKIAERIQKQQQIEQLLSQAEVFIAQERISRPADYSAYARYQAVLKLQADNKSAKRALETLPATTQMAAEKARQQGELERSRELIAQGLDIVPEHIGLKTLQQQVLQEQQIQNLLAKAEQLVAQRQLSQPPQNNAVATFKQVLEISPDNPNALNGLKRIADIYFEQAGNQLNRNRENESLQLIEKGLALEPDHSRLLSLQKDIQQRRQQRAALEQQQRQIENLLTLAKEQQDLKHFAQPPGNNAQESYRAILKLDPNHAAATQALAALPDLIHAQAQTELDGGARLRSHELVNEGLQLAPRHQGLLDLKATLLLQERIAALLEKAEQQFKAGHLSQPPNDNAVASYLEVLSLAAQQPQAVAGLTQVADEYARQAQALLEEGDETESQNRITAGLAVVSDHPPLLALQQKLAEREAARAAQARKKIQFEQLTEQARTEQQQGRLDNSLAIIAQSLELEPQQPELIRLQQQVLQQQQIVQLLEKADQQIELKQLTLPAGNNAVETLNEVLSLHPEHPQAIKGLQHVADAYLELARLRFENNQQDRGLLLIEKGLAVVPGYPPLLALQAATEKQIESQLRQALITDFMTRAQEQQQLEHFTQPPGDNAQESYRAILKLDPSHAAATQALAALPDLIHAQAQSELDGGARLRSHEFINEGLQLAPQHQGLLDLKAKLLLQDRVTALLQKAAQQFKAGHLSQPPDANAVASYQEVLALAADQPQAVAGLQQVADEYVRQAQALLEQDDAAESQTRITAGLAVVSDHPPLLALQQRLVELEAARAAQASQQKQLEQLLAQAQSEQQQGQLDNSLATIAQSLALEPQQPELIRLQKEVLQQQQIRQLLDKADQQIEGKQLTLPAENNALATLQEILALAPEHPEALKGMERIADAYLELARLRFENNQQDRGLLLIEKGLAVVPGYPPLLALQAATEKQIESQLSQAQITDLITQAQQQQQLEHFTQPPGDNAQESYRGVLKLDPNHIEATLALAALPDLIHAQAQRELDGGARLRSHELVNEGLQIAPRHQGLLDIKATLLLQERIAALLEKAAQQFKAGHLSQPPDANAVASYQEILALAAEQPQAVAGLQQVADEYARQAQVLLAEGDAAESQTRITAGLAVISDHQGLLALQQRLAEREAARAVQANQQTQLEQLLAQAQSEQQQGRLDKSLALLAQGLELSPQQPEFIKLQQEIIKQQRIAQLLAQAEVQIKRNQLTLPAGNNAVTTLNEVLALHPEHPEAQKSLEQVADAYVRLASNRLETGKENQALLLIERGLGVVPEHPPLLAMLEEHKALTAARADKQRQIDDLITRAQQQQRGGRYTRPRGNNAYESYRAILDIDSNNRAALNALNALADSIHKQASQAYKQDDVKKSLDLIAEGLVIRPGHKALLQLQQLAKAGKPTAEEAIKDQQTVSINRLLAQVEEQIKRTQLSKPPGNNAVASLREVLRLQPNHPQAKAGLKRIADLYAKMARDQIEAGRNAQSRTYIDQGLTIIANHEELLALQKELDVALATPEKRPQLRRGAELQERLKDGGVAPVLVYIPRGQFSMGDAEGQGFPNEKPAHQVQIKRAFYIAKYEVTFEEFDRFTDATKRSRINDQGWGRGKRPVINITWHDAQAYVKWLSQQTGKKYRLPSESEWEFAARAGTSTDYWWGNNMVKNNANCKGCGSRQGGKRTMPVGSFKGNAFGLFDTAGNVYEWTGSAYTKDYRNSSSNSSANKVARGGSWFDPPRFSRASMRLNFSRDFKNYFVGLRVVRTL